MKHHCEMQDQKNTSIRNLKRTTNFHSHSNKDLKWSNKCMTLENISVVVNNIFLLEINGHLLQEHPHW